jgi:deazaflavin-dependent oxidoreductase (nitroreductase family)
MNKKSFYAGGRPSSFAKMLNSFWAKLHTLGIAPNYLVTLEIVGRKSGKVIAFPLVMLVWGEQRYLVSMLGEQSNWVRNLRAAGGKATLRHGRVEQVLLEDVPVEERSALLKAYLQIAPGARAQISVNKDAPLEEFEKVAATYPVFKVNPRSDAISGETSSG